MKVEKGDFVSKVVLDLDEVKACLVHHASGIVSECGHCLLRSFNSGDLCYKYCSEILAENALRVIMEKEEKSHE